MAEEKRLGIKGKGLAKPEEHPKGIVEEDLSLKREKAKKLAQEKARARTLAKQQQIAERIAAASEELASAIPLGCSSGLAKPLPFIPNLFSSAISNPLIFVF